MHLWSSPLHDLRQAVLRRATLPAVLIAAPCVTSLFADTLQLAAGGTFRQMTESSLFLSPLMQDTL